MSRWKPDAADRLAQAAITLFDERGYDATTVADIAAAAGLTKRTFFRHFADKREALFGGSEELREAWVSAVAATPAGTAPLDAVERGLHAVADLFAERHALARTRARIVAANPELQERELTKLAMLSDAVAAALRARGVSASAAALAAQTGVTVFHDAFARWLQQDDPHAMRGLMDASLTDLRALISPPRSPSAGSPPG